MADPYLTVDQLRALDVDIDDDEVELAELSVAEYETTAEDYCGAAFVPRTATWTARPARDGTLELPHRLVRSVESVTDDGATTVPWGDLEARAGRICVRWRRPVTVTFSYGLDAGARPGILAGCADIVSRRLSIGRSGVGRDLLSQGVPDGGTTRYATPNWAEGRPTGFIDVDARLNAERRYLVGIW